MTNSIEDIVDVLDSIDKGERVEGDIIGIHKVKGDELFHFDHYESTYLSVSRDLIYIVDNYYRKKNKGEPDPIFKVHTTGGTEAIACLINHFKIDVSEPYNILKNLFASMKSYARTQKMKNSDLFGKLFKEIGVKFVGELCM